MATSMSEIIEKAREELSSITGLELSTTVGAIKEDRGWVVNLEMVEKHSIPDQMDILALYEMVLDEGGDVVGFDRIGMRKRVDTEFGEVD